MFVSGRYGCWIIAIAVWPAVTGICASIFPTRVHQADVIVPNVNLTWNSVPTRGRMIAVGAAPAFVWKRAPVAPAGTVIGPSDLPPRIQYPLAMTPVAGTMSSSSSSAPIGADTEPTAWSPIENVTVAAVDTPGCALAPAQAGSLAPSGVMQLR